MSSYLCYVCIFISLHSTLGSSATKQVTWCSDRVMFVSCVSQIPCFIRVCAQYSYSQVHASPMDENCLLSRGILGVGLVCFHTWDYILTSRRQMLRLRFMSFCSFQTFIIHYLFFVSDVARLGWLNAALPWELRWRILADFVRTHTMRSHETF